MEVDDADHDESWAVSFEDVSEGGPEDDESENDFHSPVEEVGPGSS